MGTLDEAVGSASPLRAALDAGVDALSQVQEITFTKYVRVVLPLDGYVFWVKATLLSPSALFNSMAYNEIKYDQSGVIVADAPILIAKGSLHYASATQQTEDANYAKNTVVFTSEDEVKDLNTVDGNQVFIAEFEGVRFSFSSRGSYYRQANLYHYVGNALYSTMDTQLVDNPEQLNTRDVIVSNSLPAWLALSNYIRPYSAYINQPPIPLYPSFLVPDNIAPPFGAVHIYPEGTQALQSAPLLDSTLSHTQLAKDRVRITFYGLRNDRALDFIDSVNQYSLDTDVIGIMNIPTMRDEKLTQNELNILAQKKTVEYDVSYYQSSMRNIARQYIKHAIIAYYPQDN